MAKGDPNGWRYAFAREMHDGEYGWSIRELYTRDEKLSWAGPITPHGETWMSLADTLAMMSGASGSKFLDLTLDPPQLVRYRATLHKKQFTTDEEAAHGG